MLKYLQIRNLVLHTITAKFIAICSILIFFIERIILFVKQA